MFTPLFITRRSTTTVSTSRFKIGDLVIVAPLYARPTDRGVVYRVAKVLKVNIDAVPVRGGRTLRANPDAFLPAPDNLVAALGDAGTPAATVEMVPMLPTLWQATVVTITGPGWKHPADQLWVVLKDKVDKVSVARLGGVDRARYYPSVPRSYLTAVDPAHLTYTAP
jgi:hypothetical protein